ncbi:MAG TPA: ribonuclease HI family protein [Nitrososphaeraceae archaeon]|nr:ribonuclease HI family protein [Nitrososphaeraceae archaeon]
MTIHIDGASRGNPGPSGIGVVIIKNKLIIAEYNEFIGKKTNNQAEYVALKKALQIASILDNEITVLSDSKLVVSQRKNKYRVRNKQIKIIFREISNLEKQFRTVIYRYIPRAKNHYADFLANRAIDERLYNNINNKSAQ